MRRIPPRSPLRTPRGEAESEAESGRNPRGVCHRRGGIRWPLRRNPRRIPRGCTTLKRNVVTVVTANGTWSRPQIFGHPPSQTWTLRWEPVETPQPPPRPHNQKNAPLLYARPSTWACRTPSTYIPSPSPSGSPPYRPRPTLRRAPPFYARGAETDAGTYPSP